MSDLESRVERLAVVDFGIDVPIEREEIDTEPVGPSELLLDGARGIVLPAGDGLAVLVRSVD
jgi:hypothetical protein